MYVNGLEMVYKIGISFNINIFFSEQKTLFRKNKEKYDAIFQ